MVCLQRVFSFWFLVLFCSFLVNFTNLSWKEFNINNINILSIELYYYFFSFFFLFIFFFFLFFFSFFFWGGGGLFVCLVPGVGGGH